MDREKSIRGSPLLFDHAIKSNILAAQEAMDKVEFSCKHPEKTKIKDIDNITFNALRSRECVAATLILCVCSIESSANWAIALLDRFVYNMQEEICKSSLSTIDKLKLIYRICGKEFDLGKAEYGDIKVITQIRNELVHDKPNWQVFGEKVNSYNKFIKFLNSKIGRKPGAPDFTLGDHIHVIVSEHKLFPCLTPAVARWAYKCTNKVNWEVIKIAQEQRQSGSR